jgi:hypothetical protein
LAMLKLEVIQWLDTRGHIAPAEAHERTILGAKGSSSHDIMTSPSQHRANFP